MAAIGLFAAPALAEDAVGNWFGAMDGHNLTFVHIEKGPDGLSGWVDTHELPADPNNHNDHGPLDTLSATPDHLTFHFVLSKSSATFDGQWDAAKKAWVGKSTWRGGHKATLTLWRTEATTLATARMPPPKEVNDTAALDRIAKAYVDNGTFMGSVLVARGERILLNKAYGFASVELKVPNAPNTRYMIGSISKQFAAAAILMLEEQGQLKTDDPVSKYIPGTPDTWKAITLRNLLTHTSGIPDSFSTDRARKSIGQPVTQDDIIADAETRPLEFAPDSQFAYSNTNYTLLARIVERVSGETYADFLDHHVFAPLGMKDSSLDNGWDLIPNRATGYSFGTNGLISQDYWDAGWAQGSGGIISTTHDMLLWERALMGGKVLRSETVQRMTTPYKNRYGYGVAHGPFNGYSVIEHAGNIRGFHSDMAYFQDDKLTIIVLSNVEGLASKNLWPRLAEASHGNKVELPPARKIAKVSPDILKAYVGTYRVKASADILRTYVNISASEEKDEIEVAVSLEGNNLTLRTSDYNHALTAESDTRFFLIIPDAHIEFAKDDTGKRVMILEQNGQKITAPRRE